MKTHAKMLAVRRQMLIAECNLQRADLALQVRPLAYTLSSVNIGMRILGRVRQHPEWIAAATLGLFALRPRRLSAFFRFGSNGLRIWRHVQPLLQQRSHLPQVPLPETNAAGVQHPAITPSDTRFLHRT